jgi:hypothetical protein
VDGSGFVRNGTYLSPLSLRERVGVRVKRALLNPLILAFSRREKGCSV